MYKILNKFQLSFFSNFPSTFTLALVFSSACSTTTHIKWDDSTNRWTYQRVSSTGVASYTTPAEMTPEQKKSINPLHQSSYLIKEEVENIPVLSPREEALEGREEYYLGYHDILRITVFGRHDPVKGVTDITRDTEIRDDGMISYPLIEDIKAAGLTILELQHDIIEKLKEYIVAPKIDIQIIKYGTRYY